MGKPLMLELLENIQESISLLGSKVNNIDNRIAGLQLGIKKVQRGSSAGAGNVTIPSVNLTKTFVRSVSKGSAGSVSVGNMYVDAAYWTSSDSGSVTSHYFGLASTGGNYEVQWDIKSKSSTSTDLTTKEYGAKLINSTTLYCDGPCEWEVIEFN